MTHLIALLTVYYTINIRPQWRQPHCEFLQCQLTRRVNFPRIKLFVTMRLIPRLSAWEASRPLTIASWEWLQASRVTAVQQPGQRSDESGPLACYDHSLQPRTTLSTSASCPALSPWRESPSKVGCRQRLRYGQQSGLSQPSQSGLEADERGT